MQHVLQNYTLHACHESAQSAPPPPPMCFHPFKVMKNDPTKYYVEGICNIYLQHHQLDM
jgi:hypothetical protein